MTPTTDSLTELNPVGRFFKELRKVIADRVFAKKEEVESCLSYWMQEYQKQPETVIHLTKFT